MLFQSSILLLLSLSTLPSLSLCSEVDSPAHAHAHVHLHVHPRINVPPPAPVPGVVSVLKQATRDQIIARFNRASKRAAPSPTPPPETVSSVSLIYGLYFSGSGVIETDNNPGNSGGPDRPPVTITIPGTTPQNTAIQQCADQSQSLPDEYYQFQIYFDQPATGDGVWVCTSYYNQNNDPGYFNVQRASASPVYGYSRIN
ncbi:hypothetical protein I302_102345 [Kwoniella bestiolae CBS 10118]|uniref:Ubiquitin 3 binding protein But2 C-terminal domain-containing protein n=1 Tax=Kwoniella bestiolae CBS 10118 TaxID=1296100 RepID=A0A1B9GEX7_9TREE|nr:hypothetical protein I302_01038 [Kwoniella bestiolae CBS 10118]OCF29531.1 hypothetical protein I302_01038 [Kwoniella bestiolae CBS 10118]